MVMHVVFVAHCKALRNEKVCRFHQFNGKGYRMARNGDAYIVRVLLQLCSAQPCQCHDVHRVRSARKAHPLYRHDSDTVDMHVTSHDTEYVAGVCCWKPECEGDEGGRWIEKEDIGSQAVKCKVRVVRDFTASSVIEATANHSSRSGLRPSIAIPSSTTHPLSSSNM